MHKAFPFGLVALALLFTSALEAQSLRGSPASVDRMYRQALSNDLHFFDTSAGVRKAAREGDLVRLRENGDFQLGSVSHAYVLPSTRAFVQRLGRQYRSACGDRLVVTSGIRPRSMKLSNSTSKSVHPTGMAIDLRKPRGGRCLSWLRETLAELEAEGVIEATEERRPPHFHVAVFPGRYQRYAGLGSGDTPTLSTRSARGGDASSSEKSEKKAKSGKSEKKAKTAASSAAGEEGRTHKVRKGESIWTIARRNNITVEHLKSANKLQGSRIVAGQVLVIPRGD